MDFDKIEIKRDPVIIFMGTPEFSVPVLEGLISKYKVRAIVTQPDRPVGRSGEVKCSPVKEVALKHNILCLQPNKIREALQEINVLEPDLIIISRKVPSSCRYGADGGLPQILRLYMHRVLLSPVPDTQFFLQMR